MKKTIRFMAWVLALAFVIGAGAGSAFAAAGDILGLVDFNTYQSSRINTFDVDFGEETSVDLMIVKLIDDGMGDAYIGWFDSQTDAQSVTWSHNTPDMGNTDLSTAMFVGAEDGGTGSGKWYLTTTNALDVYGYYLGPDSWKGTYGSVEGDFSFVATEFGAQDTGTVSNISIEFYKGDPTQGSSTFIVKGSFSAVLGNDDYFGSTLIGHGRSYPTALDSVAHGTLPPGNIISTYTKYQGTQGLRTITDNFGNVYPSLPSVDYGWMYGVYYPDPDTKGQYNLDATSKPIAADDYLLLEDALVIWGIGNSLSQYDSFYPSTINR